MGNAPPATPQPSVSPTVSREPSAPTFSPAPTVSSAPTVGWTRVGDGQCAGSEVANLLAGTWFPMTKEDDDPSTCYDKCISDLQDNLVGFSHDWQYFLEVYSCICYYATFEHIVDRDPYIHPIGWVHGCGLVGDTLPTLDYFSQNSVCYKLLNPKIEQPIFCPTQSPSVTPSISLVPSSSKAPSVAPSVSLAPKFRSINQGQQEKEYQDCKIGIRYQARPK